MARERAKRGRRKAPPRRAERLLGAVALAASAFNLGAAGVGEAAAASFELSNGVALEGAVAASSPRFLSIDTDEGVRLVARTAIDRVRIEAAEGVAVAGLFKDWRDGVYVIDTAEGPITAPERPASVALRIAAPKAAPDIAAPKTEAPETDAIKTAAQEAVAAAAPAGPAAEQAAEAPPAPSATAAPTPRAAPDFAAEEWMRSPAFSRPEDGFRARIDGGDDVAFDNPDHAAEIDRTRQRLETARALAAPPPAGLVLRRPPPEAEPPTSEAEPADAPTLVDRRGPPESLLFPDAAETDQAADLSAPRALVQTPVPAPAGEMLAQADLPPSSSPAALGAEPPGSDDTVRGLLRSIIEGDSQPAPPPSAEPRLAPLGGEPLLVDPLGGPQLGLDPLAPPLGSELNAIERPVQGVGAAAARLRDPALDYQEGVIGAPHPQPQYARSCARLSRIIAPPLMNSARAAPGRGDPAALRIGFGGDVSDNAVAALAEAFLRDAGVGSAEEPAPSDAAVLVTASGRRLIRPERMLGQRLDRLEDAAAAAAGGSVDLTLTPPPPGGATAAGIAGPESGEELNGVRLIGFDAVALVAHPDNPAKRLTRRDLHSLLSGAATDWSMVDPNKVGAPRLYLPPPGSPELISLAQAFDVRRLSARGARYEPDPAKRVAGALADPNGLAVVSRSALGEARPIAIGREGAAAEPTLDGLRSGAYPLAIPLYVTVPPESAHPAGAVFADFLARPQGQRAIYDAGLMPVAACDPSTCSLSAPGMEAARAALAPEAHHPPIELLPDRPAAGGRPVAEIQFPAGASPTPDETVETLLTAIKTLSARPEGDRYLLVARAGVIGGPASQLRRAQAQARAEAAALSLRCAGLIATQVAVDARPLSGAFNSSDQTASIAVEIIPVSP